MQFYVNVSDVSNVYLYGPFATESAAKAWADEHADAFMGRIIHVVSSRNFIDPYEER
jgi:hypothetical protein